MRRALLTSIFICACSRVLPSPVPAPRRIVPTGAYRGQAVQVRVWGDGFDAHAVHRLGGGAQVDDRFHVRIAGIDLPNAVWKGPDNGHQLIEADAPADLPAGKWDVEVQDPVGQVGTLQSAWTESDGPPPQLSISAALPTRIEADVPFSTQVRLQNAGGEPALLQSVLLDGVAVAFGDPTLAAGEVRLLEVQRSAAAGPASWPLTLQAMDEVTGNALSANGAAQLVGLRPPQLTVIAGALPASIDVGQAIAVSLTVRNDGEVDALSVVPALEVGAGVTVDGLQPQDVPAGAQVVYAATLRAASAGALPVAVSASGVDGLTTAALVVAQQQVARIEVQEPAQLTVASISAPSTVDRGQSFAVTLVVRNTGGATAHAVAAALSIVASGGAAATVGAPPAAVDIGGNSTASFTFQLLENGTAPGALSLTLSAAGTDINSGAAVSTSGVASVTVQSRPALEVISFTLPSLLSDGQAFTASMTVHNGGQTTARGFSVALPSVATTGAAAASTSSATAPVDLAGGQSATFTWAYVETGAGTGTLQLSAAVSATDANDGSALSTSGTSNVATVQLPAALFASVSVPATVDRGQSFNVLVTVTNTGGATAAGVRAAVPDVSASGGATASTTSTVQPVSLGAGQSAVFTFTFIENGTGPGTLAFSSSATGVDANSRTAIASPRATPAATTVQTPARLVVTAFSVPAVIDRGQAFTVSLTVQNTGGAIARAVSAAPSITVTGGAHASTTSAPAPLDLASGQSQTFTWSYTEDGTAPGTLAVSVSVSGTDANTLAALSAAPTPASVAVQAPAALSATWTAPASAQISTSFTATLTVTNTGGATALGVAPSATVTGTGTATLASGPSPASASLTGGAAVAFSWTVSAVAVGNVQIFATVTGADGNTAAQVQTSATSPLIALGEATTLSTDPFAGDGTTFSYLFSYQSQIYLGPNKSGTGAVRMAPDGSNAAQVNWQPEVNTDPANAARNSAYQGTGVLCHTIGFPGCNSGTTQCGPDNESGHGIFVSGFTGSTEWYLLTGASTIGGARYLYMNNPAMPLAPGGYDDLAFVQVQAGQAGSTRMATAGHFFNRNLYLGFLDGGTTPPGQTAPVLNVLTRMPTLPGFTADATNNTDLVNLQAVNMPAIGSLGSPANSGASWLMIDAISDFNGVLYLGNNGGLVRSANGNPGACSGSCTDWINSTPSASSWGAKTSVTVDSTVLGTLEPAQRAISGIVAFGGRLFAARNTTSGPQLWSCNPTGGANPQQCDLGDWSVVANVSDLTQLGDSGNSAATLLAATGSHLYLGYNNAKGIQIWRTTNAAATAISDFTGRADCVAGTSGCQPVGGAGLGNGSTRIFDGKALTLAGQEWLYVSAGDGTTAPRISRIVP